jgi:hypothetical protein
VFSGTFAYLKHHFSHLVQIVFLNAQNVENAFEWPFVIMKHLFIYITKVVSYDVQKADYEFSGPFAYLKNHLSDLVQVAFFHTMETHNEIAWPLDTLKHLLSTSQKSYFKTVKKADYESSGLFAYLKLQLSDLDQVAILDARKAQNEIAWPQDTL